ncbi:uncharacterized protein BKA55DRAFT_689060 [Fusarium redolens]|uniref:Uncharacterized protein n=1 Tax=Fusarium redolens TaxID=48865 RepID=A0A9P9H9S6_FUSRE|nr:uncharacterized protein BKA55DRAFT_689060 [Fusarium redolens]KAH7253563.1 hypothetical protein BKA55DRAFT_689060 [Fusarium redolens]
MGMQIQAIDILLAATQLPIKAMHRTLLQPLLAQTKHTWLIDKYYESQHVFRRYCEGTMVLRINRLIKGPNVKNLMQHPFRKGKHRHHNVKKKPLLQPRPDWDEPLTTDELDIINSTAANVVADISATGTTEAEAADEEFNSNKLGYTTDEGFEKGSPNTTPYLPSISGFRNWENLQEIFATFFDLVL